MLWKAYKEQLAFLLLIFLIPGLWVGHGFMKKYLDQGLPEAVIGVTIVTWTLVIQYFFRKKEGTPEVTQENGGKKPNGTS